MLFGKTLDGPIGNNSSNNLMLPMPAMNAPNRFTHRFEADYNNNHVNRQANMNDNYYE